MQPDIEHAGGEQAGIIDAHGVHPAMAELHVADLAVFGLLAAAHRVASHPAAHVLVAGRDRNDAGLLLFAAARQHQLAQHVVFHERQEFVVVLVLVVVSVDIDDQNLVEFALVRLLAGVCQEPGSVELLDGHAAAAIGDQIHDVPPREVRDPLVPAKAGIQRWIPACAGMSGNMCVAITAPSNLATCRARRRRGRRRAITRSP